MFEIKLKIVSQITRSRNYNELSIIIITKNQVTV